MPEEPFILGVDVGGTFTDFSLIASDGSIRTYKRPSTPGDPAQAIIEGLREIEIAPKEVVHGSTVATNAIIERKGARTALITSAGFRDVLEIGRQTRPRLYDLSPRREPPLVPDDLRFEIRERLDRGGGVLESLNSAEVERLLDRVEEFGVESLAVCFLFSFLNPRHERAVAKAARKRGIPTSASFEVLPEHREYERTSTTVANAYIAPVMERYLSALKSDLAVSGVRRFRVMSSSGGAISPETAGRLAVRTAVSGPAGGVTGAFATAGYAGFDRIITLDMGGTSTDVSLCPGSVLRRDETMVGAFPVRGPTVDVLSVGAGGGSIARIDPGGALNVGPRSAGADPGPACYGRGTEPTVTDAHVVLGRITPEHFLEGRMRIDPALAREAVLQVSGPYGGDADRTAAAILRVANANMERALRVVSVERGHDPRDFTLVPFGGAGGLHACDLADAVRMNRILVPRHPGVLSALGMATAPVVSEHSAAVLQAVDPRSDGISQLLAERFEALASEATEALNAGDLDPAGASMERSLEMRYMGQSFELNIAIQDTSPSHLLPLFHEAHQERYGHSHPDRTVEVVTARLRLSLPANIAPISVRVGPEPASHPNESVATQLVGWASTSKVRRLETPFYRRSEIMPGAEIVGPAVIVQMDSTCLIAPSWRATVDGAANLVLARRDQPLR